MVCTGKEASTSRGRVNNACACCSNRRKTYLTLHTTILYSLAFDGETEPFDHDLNEAVCLAREPGSDVGFGVDLASGGGRFEWEGGDER